MKLIWIAVITHKFGANFYAAATEALLYKVIRDEFVEQWWDEGAGTGGGNGPMPDDPQEAVLQYFEDHFNETLQMNCDVPVVEE
jgi:hypothetical protein